MQPLPLGESGGLWVEVSVDAAAERLEVASYGQEEGAARTAHFACGLAGAGAEPGGAAPPSLASARALCPRPAELRQLYAAFERIGLQYGGGFRTLAAAWSSGGADGGVAARLRRRRCLGGTQVHPADLDGALQLTALLAKSAGSETRLPFSVGEAALSDASGTAWPVAERQGASLAGVWIGAKDAKAANALERQLSSRKSIQELNDAHIMKTAVQDKAGQIEGEKKRSSLNSMLERRPTVEECSG